MSRSLVRAAYRTAATGLDLLGLKAAVRSHVLPRLLAAAQSSPQAAGGELMVEATAAAIDAEIRRVLAEPGMILVGPWTSEVGFELIYWLPFLAWLREMYRVPRERLVAVTRGGAGDWYANVAGRTVELFERVDPSEFRARTASRWESVGGQKQIYLDDWEIQLLEDIRGDLRAEGVEVGNGVLHPHLMYNAFYAVWQGGLSTRYVYSRMRFAALPPPQLPEGQEPPDLPEDFTAVRFYFRPSLPDTQTNRRAIARLVERIAGLRPVVLLNPGLEIDDHADWMPDDGERIIRIADAMGPTNNLAVQSYTIARSSGFVGTYGGLSYLAPLYGRHAVALRSELQHNLAVHAEVAEVAAAAAGGSLSIIDMAGIDVLMADTLAAPTMPG